VLHSGIISAECTTNNKTNPLDTIANQTTEQSNRSIGSCIAAHKWQANNATNASEVKQMKMSSQLQIINQYKKQSRTARNK